MSALLRGNFRIIAILVMLVLAGGGAGAALAHGGDDPPVTVPATGEEPIVTPGPGTPWVTDPVPVYATPDIFPINGEAILEMPDTGAGTTAHDGIQRNHTGYYTTYVCQSGYKYALYQYIVHHGSGINSYHTATTISFTRVGYCSWF